MRRHLCRVALLLVGTAMLSSCSLVVDDGRISFVDADAQLLCEEASSVILASQSVPTADHIPCIDAMPAGWRLEGTEYRSDGTSVAFASSRAPIADLEVAFSATCAAASTVVSDATGPVVAPAGAAITTETLTTAALPVVRIVIQGEGYCTEFSIELEADEAIALDDFPTWRWIPRSQIDQWVLAGTNDRLRLDP